VFCFFSTVRDRKLQKFIIVTICYCEQQLLSQDDSVTVDKQNTTFLLLHIKTELVAL